MKKFLILTIGAALFFSSCSDDPVTRPKTDASSLTVKQEQRAFVGYVGATWCPPCGAYGGPGYKAIRDAFSTDQLVSFYCAPSGETAPYITGGEAPFLTEFISKVMKPGGTIPYFNVNGVNVGGAYTKPSSTLSIHRKGIDEILAKTPVIGIAASKTLTGDKLSCNVAVEAFGEYTGSIYYSVFAVEKKVNGFQKITDAPSDDNYEHHYVLRASLVGDGTMVGQELFKEISTGGIATGARFEESFSLDFEAMTKSSTIDWNYTPDNTILVASVWLKESDGNYSYVNSVIAE